MICPQSVAIGVAAASLGEGGAKEVVRRMLPYFAAVLAAACLVTGLASILFAA